MIKDLYKVDVYKLAEWRNINFPSISLHKELSIVPVDIITKALTAELKLNQKDEDSLPDYEILDSILKGFIDDDKSVAEIVNMGFDRKIVKGNEHLIYISEYKRYQSAPGTKLSRRAFWLDRRYQIVNQWRDKS